MRTLNLLLDRQYAMSANERRLGHSGHVRDVSKPRHKTLSEGQVKNAKFCRNLMYSSRVVELGGVLCED